MSSNRKADVAIVGAGILGLAHAYFAAKRGRSVVVFERTPQAQGASVRNFGMIWPIGQRAGVVHQTATRSRQVWNEILDEASLPYRPTGSLHVVYHQDEAEVARDFVERRRVSATPARGFPLLKCSRRAQRLIRRDYSAESGVRQNSPSIPARYLPSCRLSRRKIRRSIPLRHGSEIDPATAHRSRG